MAQFFLDSFYQPTVQACITDLTPPTFAGITGLTAQANGTLLPQWSAATDATPPVYYDLYIQEGTATGLFSLGNLTKSVFGVTSSPIFTLADGTPLANGATYYVGVRARDGVGNVDSNTASSFAVSNGVPDNSVLNAIAGIWDQLRSAHTGSGSFGEALQGVLSVTRAANLDNLDATVSSRLASAGYTAPDNTGIAAIKAKTDNLPSDPASNTQVLTRAPASTALDNTVWTNAKAAFIDAAISSRATPSDVSAAQAFLENLIELVPGLVWDELLTAHTTSGTFGANAQNPPLSPTAVASAVWNALLSSYNAPGSFGANAQNPPLNPTQIADAVWDAPLASHTDAGSFGENAQSPSLNPAQVASAVWDALTTAYADPATFGKLVQDILTAAQSAGGGGGGGAIYGEVDTDGVFGEIDDVAELVGEVDEC